MRSDTIKLSIGGALAAIALALGSFSAVVSAAPQDDHKVTICHATNSVTNPYVQETVDVDSADGNTGNDNGKGDHSTHTGPVATSESQAQGLKDNKQAWGDIIPAHDNYAGLNWSAEGQAVYNNDCKYATPGRGGDTTGTATNTSSAQASQSLGGTTAGGQGGTQVAAPQGAVAAGAGGATALNGAALAGLGGSLASVLTGLALAVRRRL